MVEVCVEAMLVSPWRTRVQRQRELSSVQQRRAVVGR